MAAATDEQILEARRHFQVILQRSELRRLRYLVTQALKRAQNATSLWHAERRAGNDASFAKELSDNTWDIYTAFAIQYEALKGHHLQVLDRRLLNLRTKEERAASVFAELKLPNPPVPGLARHE